jgi:hypothetical protein
MLSHAEALLAAGDRPKAREVALAAQAEFARTGRDEPAWRGWVLVARASANPAEVRESCEKATNSLAALQKKWDAETYQTYMNRPDVQFERGLLSRLLSAK